MGANYLNRQIEENIDKRNNFAVSEYLKKIWQGIEREVPRINQVSRSIPVEQKRQLETFFKKYPLVSSVYLFGSYGTEFQLPSSDIDLGIVFTEPVDLKTELQIDAELSIFLRTDKIDLVNLDRTPVSLQYKALKQGELLIENNPIINSNFIEKVLKQYWDYRISHEIFMQDYETALREEYVGG